MSIVDILPIALCCGVPILLLLLLARRPSADSDDAGNPASRRVPRDRSDP